VALVAFLLFLAVMWTAAPEGDPVAAGPAEPVSGAVFLSVGNEDDKASVRDRQESLEAEPERKPRPPERFRPASAKAEGNPTTAPLPPATPGRQDRGERVAAAPEDLPLSYLMKFHDMQAFHAFLEGLSDASPARPMSPIRIENLPGSVPEMQRLFESYRMEPFLFNPGRFNYLITGGFKLLRDKAAIDAYIARVGRYLREEQTNAAYAAIRSQMVDRARSREAIRRAISDDAEFDHMVLGLASPYLRRFFRKLEDDTARQVTELTGRPVAVGDIARIDCRFKNVNGVMVLVPWEACLGTGPDRRAVAIWRE